MGLHRKRSLYDNFADPAARQRALRVFCCCYILDRRWSFGTGLSFALVDGDIDSTLLESVSAPLQTASTTSHPLTIISSFLFFRSSTLPT